MPYATTGKILENRELIPGFFEMDLQCPDIAGAACPGQFVQVRCSSGLDPLLRKPISISLVLPQQGIIRLLYQVRGRGTSLMSRKPAGETVSLIGPLGSGFSLPDEPETLLIMGGGIGVAPLLELARVLHERDCITDVVLGFNRAEDVMKEEEFSRYARRVLITTMDGSCGIHGHSCVPLDTVLDPGQYSRVYACGPEKMLENVAGRASMAGVACQVSLEEYMACGIGVCLGCARQIHGPDGNRYVRVCVEGPVMDGAEVYPVE